MGENRLEAEKRIKKLEEQIAKKQADLVRAKGRLSEKERKARNRKLFQAGRLLESAGLLDADPGFLLGYLLAGTNISSGSERWKVLREKGNSVLKEQKKKKGD